MRLRVVGSSLRASGSGFRVCIPYRQHKFDQGLPRTCSSNSCSLSTLGLVEDSGVRVWSSGFRVIGSGVEGFGGKGSSLLTQWALLICGSWLRVEGLRLMVEGLEYRGQDLGFRVLGSELRF